ncbi:MAG TPA: HAMP domain-containing sensor histidine kinase [Blastocatellia bacterium]|nr:HAMP domain-containing sensor histidine kinase [Blastocatellia bacterium]
MRRWSRSNLSSRTKLVALAVVALMLPTTILSIIQYRSLVDLEGKTKVAVQDNLRQTLQTITYKVQDNLKSLARKTLGPIDKDDLKPENFEKLDRYFASVKREHPEIEHLFVYYMCDPMDKYYTLFYTPDGLKRIGWPQIKEHSDAYKALWFFDRAHESRISPDPKSEYLFWQTSCCQESANKDGRQFQEYIFHTFPCLDGKDAIAVAGLSLKPSYINETYLPRIIPELLRSCDIDDRDSALALGIFDETGSEVYTNRTNWRDYEMKSGFGPAFPRWKIALGYKDTTIEALAKDNFQKNLMLTLFVLSLLILGIILTLRATAREMRLAQAKSTFVSNVSHELKTPLALIRLFAETLELGRVKSSEKAQEYYRIINNESRRLTQLINNILDFSKIEAGRKEYEFDESNIAEVVEDVLRSYEYQIVNAGFELTTDIRQDVPTVSIDRDAISQAVLNLINNAVKYSDEVKKIAVRVRAKDGFVAIEVADSGIGIPRSEHEKIFEKFYRVSTGLVHNTKGSGLGLALVKHIVEAHKGKITVESAPDKGSKFIILIPAIAARVTTKEVNYDGGYKVAESPNN